MEKEQRRLKDCGINENGAVLIIMSHQRPRENENAVADFFAKEHKKLVGFLLRKINDISEMDAEDILQDLLVTLFERTDLTIHVENFAAYIYRALYHKSIDWLRKRKPTISLDSESHLEIDSNKQWNGKITFDLAEVIENKEFKERLSKALDTLDSRQRAVWIGTEIEGYTFRELSQFWNEPIGTLLSRKSRANKILQNSLSDFKTKNS